MAQTSVSGTVVDETGESVIGASVVVKGTTTGTITDVEGKFTISVPANNKTLVFALVGMQTTEAQASANMKVVMKADTELLDEVMVVAYGTVKKTSFTGAASTVGAAKIEKQQVSNLSNALEGEVAGVRITGGSGQPGSGGNIRVRGLGSLSATSTALVVLDGVPYEGDLSSINSQDIETMTVLKDAAATSLYGTRAANGVVLVTTKKGKSGRTKVELDTRLGFNTLGVPKYDILESPGEYYELYWEGLRNQSVFSSGLDYVTAGVQASNDLIDVLGYNNYNVPNNELVNPITGRLNSNAKLMYHDDWLDEAFKTGARKEVSLRISGGSEKTTYYTSLNYLDEESYTRNSDFSRVSARLNIDQEVNSWFKVGLNSNFANTKTNELTFGSTTLSNIFYFGQTIAPIYPVYVYDSNGNRVKDENGADMYDYGDGAMGARPKGKGVNAISQQKYDLRETTIDAVSIRGYAQISFLEDFKFTINGGLDNYNLSYVRLQTPIGGDAANVGGRGTRQASRGYSLSSTQLLNWTKTLEYDHHLDVLLAHEIKKDRGTYLAAQKTNYEESSSNAELANAAKIKTVTSYAQEYAIEGLFAQLKYDYRDKYYLSSTIRRDASSRFSKNDRWGTFWSVGASWRIDQEDFMADVDWVNDLRIRTSCGTQGNDRIGTVIAYENAYSVLPYTGEAGANHVFWGSKALTWEKSKQFDLGLEAKLFDKLTASIGFFNKQSDDLLFIKTLIPSQGTPSVKWENAMGINNKGLEVELLYDIIKTNDLKWDFLINASFEKTKLTQLPPDRPNGWPNGEYFFKKGESPYTYYKFKYMGVDPDNGAPQYLADVIDPVTKKVTGTKIVNSTGEATRYVLDKRANPDVYGGFSTNASYKGFDLGLSFSYELGGWVQDTQYAGLMSGGSAGGNWHKDIYNRWTPDNRYTSVPRLEVDNQEIAGASDRFLVERSNLSLRNATFGYTFPKNTLSKLGVEKLRLYVVGDNLFLISKRKGLDPRQSFSGATGYHYSPIRTVSFGINLNF
ncbi:TonB-dependent receptor [Dysgonomonas sp. 216]|nr:TonB-dependent receptor [Dysgonomonas sp. 216]